MEQFLLQDKEHGYYWIWFRRDGKQPRLSGPHSDKMLNLPVIKVDNPASWKPEETEKATKI